MIYGWSAYLSTMAKNKYKIDLKNEFYSNKNCNDYSKRETVNIVKYGHDKNGKQRFKCKTCGDVFIETKNTFFYNRKLSEDQIILICKLLVEKNGIRAIERITGIHYDTISDVVKDIARHAREVTASGKTHITSLKPQITHLNSYCP